MSEIGAIRNAFAAALQPTSTSKGKIAKSELKKVFKAALANDKKIDTLEKAEIVRDWSAIDASLKTYSAQSLYADMEARYHLPTPTAVAVQDGLNGVRTDTSNRGLAGLPDGTYSLGNDGQGSTIHFTKANGVGTLDWGGVQAQVTADGHFAFPLPNGTGTERWASGQLAFDGNLVAISARVRTTAYDNADPRKGNFVSESSSFFRNEAALQGVPVGSSNEREVTVLESTTPPQKTDIRFERLPPRIVVDLGGYPGGSYEVAPDGTFGGKVTASTQVAGKLTATGLQVTVTTESPVTHDGSVQTGTITF